MAKKAVPYRGFFSAKITSKKSGAYPAAPQKQAPPDAGLASINDMLKKRQRTLLTIFKET